MAAFSLAVALSPAAFVFSSDVGIFVVAPSLSALSLAFCCRHFVVGTLLLAHSLLALLYWHFRYQHFRWHFVVSTFAAGTFDIGTCVGTLSLALCRWPAGTSSAGTFVISTSVGTLLLALPLLALLLLALSLSALSHIQLAFSPPVTQSPDFDVLSEPRLRR